MMKWINRQMIKAYVAAQNAAVSVKDDESGMEVLQVVLLLGVGVVAIGVLMTISGKITGGVGGAVDALLEKFQ